MSKLQEDSDRIFTAISTGAFESYKEAERTVLMLYVPDMDFDRGGICDALGRLKKHYAAPLQEQEDE